MRSGEKFREWGDIWVAEMKQFLLLLYNSLNKNSTTPAVATHYYHIQPFDFISDTQISLQLPTITQIDKQLNKQNKPEMPQKTDKRFGLYLIYFGRVFK